MDTAATSGLENVYAVINNIPSFYRSADLRRFFSQFVETNGFGCFHFRHRPEKQSVKTTDSRTDASSIDSLPNETNNTSSKQTAESNPHTFCCIIRLTEVKLNAVISAYHERKWRDSKGDSVSSKCLISRIKTTPSIPSNCAEEDAVPGPSTALKYQTKADRRQVPPGREELKEEDLLKLPELRPPTVMPQGNVGTPTTHFMSLIKECRLPPSIIKKLQLDFPNSKNKGKYGNVAFDYHTGKTAIVVCDTDSDNDDAKAKTTAETRDKNETIVIHSERTDANNLPAANSDAKALAPQSTTQKAREPELDYKEKRRLKKIAKRETRRLMAERIEEKMIEFERAGSGSGEDNDSCEEWERHEAMYDDVTSQGRNKDRLFEEDMEVVWEKGGSGLVFYTDAQYWQEKEGDFDEQTTDDLNVDMSVYYEDGAGDMDMRDFMTIRKEQRRRRGIENTDRVSAGIGKVAVGIGKVSAGIGKFERHTKGFGRKILEKQGWTDGEGLGSSEQGIADALDNEGKHPRDKQGLGYHGERLVRFGWSSQKRKRKAVEGEVMISTVYDDPSETDPLEPPKRRHDPSYLKHRDRIN